MLFKNYKDVVEHIKTNISIKSILNNFNIDVTNAGTNPVALCPFHNDTKPSLRLYENNTPERYHCFACNASGTVIDFVMEYKGLQFKEAIQWFCTTYYLAVEAQKDSFRKWKDPFEFAYQTLKRHNCPKQFETWESKREFDKGLLSEKGLLYLNRNSLSGGKSHNDLFGFSRDEFGLLQDAGITRLVSKTEKDPKTMTYINLGSFPSEVFWYKHILFPIRKTSGKIAGFAAREDENSESFKGPKYRYSKGFKRSDNLYRIDHVFNVAKDESRKQRKINDLSKVFDLFIVEGFMDALRLESFGFRVVALLGSSLTGEIGKSGEKQSVSGQLSLIKDLAENLGDTALKVHLFLDNDEAGRAGTRSAIKKLNALRFQLGLSVFVDVIEPDTDLKDPDDIFKNNDNIGKWKKWKYDIVDFEVAQLLGCKTKEISIEKIQELDELSKFQLHRKINVTFPFLSRDSSKVQDPKRVFQFSKLNDENNASLNELTEESIPEIQQAISQCSIEYNDIDIPIDYGSWDRLKMAGSILCEEFKTLISDTSSHEPYLAVLTPRDNGNSEPRLRALPSPEVLVLEEYLLNAIFKFQINCIGDYAIPLVYFDKDKNESITLGGDTKDSIDIETVSFAYQVNKHTVLNENSSNTTLFRHFGNCWNDYNNFVLKKIQKLPEDQDIIYPARLDIRRYYDNIIMPSITNVLKVPFENAFNNGLSIDGFEDGDHESSKSVQSTKKILQWIFDVSFDYDFIAPNGKVLHWGDNGKGIVQGPNLSAWLGNIVLFPTDTAMKKVVAKINNKYRRNNQDETIYACYARYVDDIIVFATTSQDLEELQQTFVSEIGKIGLSLSPKMPALEPHSRIDMEMWLYHNKGGNSSVYGEWVPGKSVQNDGILNRSFWLESLGRREALELLHNNEVITNFESEDIANLLKTVVRKSEELKDRDLRHIAARAIKAAYKKAKNKDDYTSIIDSYIEILSDLISCSDIEIEDVSSFEAFTDFKKILTNVWPLLISLEGFQQVLHSRYDLIQSMDEQIAQEHSDFRNDISLLILNDGLRKLEDRYFADFEKNTTDLIKDAFGFILDIRKLVLIQLAKEMQKENDGFLLNEVNLTSINDVANSDEASRVLLRFKLSAYKPKQYEAGVLSEAINADVNSSIGLFHEVVARLSISNMFAAEDSTSSCLKRLGKDSKLMTLLRCLCANNEKVEVLSSNLQLKALQIFANIVTNTSIQFKLLKTRSQLINIICNNSDENNDLYILPQPDGVINKAIKAIGLCGEKINNFFVIHNSNDDIREKLSHLEFADENWKPMDNNILESISCLVNDVNNSNWVHTHSSKLQFQTERKKLSSVIEIYRSLVKFNNTGQYLITPFHIVSKDDRYYSFSIERDKNELSLTTAFGSNHMNLHSVEVPANNSHLWKIGVAVAGLFNQSENFFKDEKVKVAKELFKDDSVEEKLCQYVLRQTLFVLSGSNWMSKKSGNGNSELPFAVEESLKRAEQISQTSNIKEMIVLWINSAFQQRLVSTTYNFKNDVKKQGSLALVMNLAVRSLLTSQSWLHNELIENCDFALKLSINLPRTLASLKLLIDLFDKGYSTELLNPIIDAYKLRFITVGYKLLSFMLSATEGTSNYATSEEQVCNLISFTENAVLAPWYMNELQFDFVNRALEALRKEPSDMKAVDSITPLGWYLIYNTLLVNTKGINAFVEINDEQKSFENKIANILTCNYAENEENWPYANYDNSTNINDAFEMAENYFIGQFETEYTLKKRLSKHSPLEKNENYVSVRSSEGERNIEFWQVTGEKFVDEQEGQFESRLDGKQKIYTFTEIWKGDDLIHVALLGNKYGEFVKKILTATQNTNKNPIAEAVLKDGQPSDDQPSDDQPSDDQPSDDQPSDDQPSDDQPSDDQPSDDQPSDDQPSDDQPSDDQPSDDQPSDDQPSDDILDDFERTQASLWREQRSEKLGRHIRVAFLQFNVGGFGSYAHPLSEICESDCNPKEIKKWKKNPTEYGINNGLENNEHKKFKSCEEFRRKKILEKTINACEKLNVDILLLPEYSIRQETLQTIKDLTKKNNIAVWCGTYRQPYSSGTSCFKGVESLQSPLFVIEKGEVVSWRGKKYPAVAMGEVFRPDTREINPLYQKKSPDKVNPGQFVFEMICAENFGLTSPLNRNPIMQGYKSLYSQFFSFDKTIDNDAIGKDIQNLSNWVGLANTTGDAGEWTKYFPRRSILLAPSMTTRSTDYHLLGQANYLSSGVCTVFCNASGKSCFIGHNSWKDPQKSKKNPYFGDKYSPYNNILPGILNLGEYQNGTIKKEDQALVICDVDPAYQNEGKPKQQLLIPPLGLIAHIPIIEVTKNEEFENQKIQEDPFNPSTKKCSCSIERLSISSNSDLINEIYNSYKAVSEYDFESLHVQKEDIVHVLQNMARLLYKKDSWIVEKANAYINHSMVMISKQPPAALYDLIFVDTSIPDDANKVPEIEVPPYRIEYENEEEA